VVTGHQPCSVVAGGSDGRSATLLHAVVDVCACEVSTESDSHTSNMDALNRGPVDLERIMSAPTFCLLGTKTGDQEVRSIVQETVLLIS
jgi:hypothetical protein